VLELVFIPTAQAFTSEELDHARLVVRTADGREAATDVLSSVKWGGSLPSPRAGLANTASRVSMQLAGSGFGRYEDGKEEWDLSLSVPVDMRE
jgi:hypothetical protein